MKIRLPLFAFLTVVSLLLASCNLPVATAAFTEQPTLTITDTPPIPAVPTPTLPGPVIAHVPAGQVISIMNIHMLDPFSGWGIGGPSQAQDHVFRTQDSGVTWRDVTPPQPAPAAGDKAIAIGDFRDASTAWVIYGSEMAPPPAYLYLWITHNGGANWQYSSIDTSISTESFSPWFIDFVDALHGWLLVYLGSGMSHNYVALLATTDGGLTWNTLVTPQDSNEIQSCSKTSMVFFDVQNGWLARECKGLYPAPHIMRTTDGGATWTRIEPPAPASAPNLFTDYACDMATPNPLSALSVIMAMKCLNMADYSTQKNYIYSTSDGGATWTSDPLPADYSLGEGLHFFDPLNGFAFGRKIFKTSDGGQTWTFVQQVTWSGQFSFVNADQGWASVSNDSNENALVKTGDGGVHWDMLNPIVVP
jgi:photosystem II stability/assembly factor-like uncharacterized protein